MAVASAGASITVSRACVNRFQKPPYHGQSFSNPTCQRWAGGASLHCTIPTEGAPSLRCLQEPALSFVEGVGGDAAGAALVRSTPPRCVCRRRTRPSTGSGRALRKVREGRGTRICGGFCSLKAGPPSAAHFRFPEWPGVALRSDLAHDNHQNSNFLFRLR